MTRGSRILGLAIRLGLAGLATFLLIGLCFEVYLRASGFLVSQPANYPCITGDPVLNHVFQPNCQGVASAQALKTEKDVTYRTNRFGYRGHVPLEGRKTLLVLGDSYTEGFGLEEGETFPALLEGFLQRPDWQVLNGGTLGFSTALYPLYFERFFQFEKPQLVLLNLDLTDFNDDPYYLQNAEFDSLGNPVAFPGRELFPQWSLGFVYSNRSALLRFLHQELNQWELVKRRDSFQWQLDKWIKMDVPLVSREELKVAGLEGCAKPVEAVTKNVLELKKRVEAVGGKLAIHMYPPGHVVKSYANLPQSISFARILDQKTRTDFSWSCGVSPKIVDIIKAFSGRQNIPFFDTFPLIVNRADRESLYFERDAHWNSSGVKLVTKDLANRLQALLSLFKGRR